MTDYNFSDARYQCGLKKVICFAYLFLMLAYLFLMLVRYLRRVRSFALENVQHTTHPAEVARDGAVRGER